MTEYMWVRSHVERLLQDEWDVCRVSADGDGDYPFRSGTAACYVSVLDGGDQPMVRVWGYAATGIKPTAAALREINELQSHSLSASVRWDRGFIIVSQTVCATGLTQPVLAQALKSVGAVAQDIGLLMAAMFNGSTPLPAELTQSEDAA